MIQSRYNKLMNVKPTTKIFSTARKAQEQDTSKQMITLSSSKKDNLRLAANRQSSKLIDRDTDNISVEALKRMEQRAKIKAMAERLYNPERNCHKRGCSCGGNQ